MILHLDEGAWIGKSYCGASDGNQGQNIPAIITDKKIMIDEVSFEKYCLSFVVSGTGQSNCRYSLWYECLKPGSWKLVP